MSDSERPSPEEAWKQQEQMSPERARLEQERGVAELPDNVPPGLLGEVGLNFMKVDDEGPHGLNAGLVQESSAQTRLLAVLLLYFIFFPAAFVVLWVSKHFSLKAKLVLSALMLVGLALLAYVLQHPDLAAAAPVF